MRRGHIVGESLTELTLSANLYSRRRSSRSSYGSDPTTRSLRLRGPPVLVGVGNPAEDVESELAGRIEQGAHLLTPLRILSPEVGAREDNILDRAPFGLPHERCVDAGLSGERQNLDSGVVQILAVAGEAALVDGEYVVE
jgi:hypothetical protein